MVSNGKLMAFINALGGGSAAPSEVVILPETEVTEFNPGSQYVLYTAPENTPNDGGTYKVAWSGGEYDSLAVDASAVWDMPSGSMFLLGNSDMMNLTTQIDSNPAPDAPFLLMLTPIGATEDGVTNYGTIFNDADVIANPTPVISIVEAAKTESAGGGGFIVNATNAQFDENNRLVSATADKTYEEVVSALEAGLHVVLRGAQEIADPKVSTVNFIPALGYANQAGTSFIIFMSPDGNTTMMLEDGAIGAITNGE